MTTRTHRWPSGATSSASTSATTSDSKLRWITVGPPRPSRDVHPPRAAGRRHRNYRRRAPHHRRDDGEGHLRLDPADHHRPGRYFLQASGAEIAQKPIEQPYGVRDCPFRDPAGNLIRVQEHGAELSGIAAMNCTDAYRKALTRDFSSSSPRRRPRHCHEQVVPRWPRRRGDEKPWPKVGRVRHGSRQRDALHAPRPRQGRRPCRRHRISTGPRWAAMPNPSAARRVRLGGRIALRPYRARSQ